MKLIGLLFILFCHTVHADAVILCDADNGLNLINREYYSSIQIEMILNSCDKVSPNTPSVLLLHGLFARKNNQNELAIDWLEKAKNAAPHDISIALELAATYETANQWTKAEQIYRFILGKIPQNRAALLGLARIFRINGQDDKAADIYKRFLLQDPQDSDALNGMGWISITQNNLIQAKNYFNESLKIQPENKGALTALNQIKLTELQKQGPEALCNAANGLILLNKQTLPVSEINTILEQCAKNKIENEYTFLLHGLLARKEAQTNKKYSEAILWLKKAASFSLGTNQNSNLELATTFEWANQPQMALTTYQQILIQSPENRAALLGQARTLKTLKKFAVAQKIYQQLIIKNPKDVEAINGMGWLELVQNKIDSAKHYFKQSLALDATNQEAIQGLKASNSQNRSVSSETVPKVILCDADNGLMLINKPNPPLTQIRKILALCDKNTPQATSNLVLHGLLDRHLALKTGNYQQAIYWLTRAMQTAEPNNDIPALELAVTYEWSGNFKYPLALYEGILARNPSNRVALLGKARVLRFTYQIKPSLNIYQQLLNTSPNNPQILSGLGELYMTNYEFNKARATFNRVLALDPNNKLVKDDLKILNQATKNVLDLTIGDYSVPPQHANGFNLNYFRNLNATDGLTVYATHNTKQIESNFGAGPTLLPNNSLLLGYQHLVPQQYGWQVSYDARQHNNLPFENRAFGAANLFLKKNLEWFGGLRLIFPDLWNTQLLTSGFTLYTSLPVNVTATGFWSFQEIGGYSSSYALDFSKEYYNHLFYNFGPSYLVEQQSWEMHGRLIFPVFKNQALIAQGSHYFFNKSTFITAGWRIYWA